MPPFVQTSFKGGMNLLSDDTRIQPDQYRIGYNLRNRYDVLEPVYQSVEDMAVPKGIMQEMVTFGNYVILFVGGNAFYRLYNATAWHRIVNFKMDTTAPRLWTAVIPVAVTNYVRLSNPTESAGTTPDAAAGIRLNQVTSAFQGNQPGLLVQDNLNQPLFIFLDPTTGLPDARITQTYGQWSFILSGDTDLTEDKREYVPIGNCMAWVDGILYVTSQDFNFIYRSVSGRPLDFVVNVNLDGTKGGDATTTSYSVGVGGISCIRPMSDGSLFVAASNSNFSVAKNFSNNAPKEWGEYTFIRKFLFNSTCLSDRTIIDSLGDTRFISLTGVRSFNAILQEQNEGRNELFSASIQSVFTGLVQNNRLSAAILYDNYEFYAVNTIFGPALAVYDTINKCWTSFDISQTDGKRIKILVKIELTIQRLFAVTEDNRFFTLYQGTSRNTAIVRTGSYADPNPGNMHEVKGIRAIISTITESMSVNAMPIVDNRVTKFGNQPKTITYSAPAHPVTDQLPDINTMLYNAYWAVLNGAQGYKTCCVLSWTGNGVLLSYAMEMKEVVPAGNPLTSQK
jgi:hypothetical protein